MDDGVGIHGTFLGLAWWRLTVALAREIDSTPTAADVEVLGAPATTTHDMKRYSPAGECGCRYDDAGYADKFCDRVGVELAEVDQIGLRFERDLDCG